MHISHLSDRPDFAMVEFNDSPQSQDDNDRYDPSVATVLSVALTTLEIAHRLSK